MVGDEHVDEVERGQDHGLLLVELAVVGGDDNAEAVRMAVKRIDMAAAKGIIHRNAAARKKSRLMKKVNAGS